jgi:hypothetical protein
MKQNRKDETEQDEHNTEVTLKYCVDAVLRLFVALRVDIQSQSADTLTSTNIQRASTMRREI